MGKGTNNVGAGKRNVSASISDELYAELKKLAKGSGVGISTYITCILVHAAETALVLPNAKSMRHRAKNGGELQLPLKSSAPLGESRRAKVLAEEQADDTAAKKLDGESLAR